MTSLGTITIRDESSVIQARKKILLAAETLAIDPITATRVATATSEMCRQLQLEANNPCVLVELDELNHRPALVLTFQNGHPVSGAEVLNSFFDEVASAPAENGVHAVRAAKILPPGTRPSSEAVRRLETLIQQKSRDELMSEVQAKNLELEAHRAQLEQTVRERTLQLEEAMRGAEAASQAKSQFLANMSHELRTPMNAILGYTEILIEEAEDEGQEDFIPDLEKISAAGRHLLSLINSVLDLAKIESGKMELFCESFELSTLIEETRTTVEPLVIKNGNQLELHVDDELGRMYADVTKLRQSLFNLVSNAAKFTEEGTITLAVSRYSSDGEERIRLDVSDTGIGIPEDKIGRVFEEFGQADESTTRDYGGTGLGLPISRKFCQMMGGDITVVSEVGKGSTFTIDLPVTVDATRAAGGTLAEEAGEKEEEEELPAAEGSAVLVIEDDPNSADLLRRTLESDGHAVVVAPGGEEGVEAARNLKPKLITLDVMMPGMDGWQVLEELKADPDLDSIPVVMVTIVDEQELGYSLGAVDYLTKPVDRDALRAVVRRYSPGHILLVEDDADVRSVVTRTLEESGQTVDEAENGAVALERMKERKPDLILLDLMMPVMDGFEFVSELRKNRDHLDIPIIVVTAKDLTEEERSSLQGSVERIVQKGSDPAELLSQVRELAGRYTTEGADGN